MSEYIIDNYLYPLGKDKDGTKTSIKEIQEIVFSIMLEIDRICRKNNIPYALAFGTALGLYNYQGFIPWDDDADIAVDYFDIPRLIEAFDKDLKEEFEYICYEKDMAICKIKTFGVFLTAPKVMKVSLLILLL